MNYIIDLESGKQSCSGPADLVFAQTLVDRMSDMYIFAHASQKVTITKQPKDSKEAKIVTLYDCNQLLSEKENKKKKINFFIRRKQKGMQNIHFIYQ